MRSCFLNTIQRLIEWYWPVHYREIGNLPWADIDTPTDLRFGRQYLSTRRPDAAACSKRSLYEEEKGNA